MTFAHSAEVTDLKRRVEELEAENAALRDQTDWHVVGELRSSGVESLSDDYPLAGIPVIVKLQSATGTDYTLHTMFEGHGKWSFPSFGVAWKFIEPQKQKG